MKKTHQAFTLIELLVVIVIIAILAGIALPVFGRVMERGKGTKDLNNLRQIGLAMLASINDNDGYMPAAAADAGGPGAWAKVLKDSEKLEDTKVFLSAFDTRPESVDGEGNFPVSFGLNSQMQTKTNTEKYKNTSSLIMMAPNPSSGNPGSLVFTGTSSDSSLTTPAPADKRGTMSNGNTIGVLFADFHVENVNWAQYTKTSGTGANAPKYKWDPEAN